MPTKTEEFKLNHYARLQQFRQEEVARLLADLKVAGLTQLSRVALNNNSNDRDLGFAFQRRGDHVVGLTWFSVRALVPKFYFYMPGCKAVRGTRTAFDKAVIFMQTNMIVSLASNEAGSANYVNNLEWRDW